MTLGSFVCIAFAVTITLTLHGNGAFFGDPPDEQRPWAVHDQNRPQPPRVEPGAVLGDAPSDALVLFDGTQESFDVNWIHTKPAEKRKGNWQIVDGALQVTAGAGFISTVESFGDCQLHLEWAAPEFVKKDGQGRGNSGVFLMGTAEVQILDNYENPTYPDGTAGAVYGVMPPAANALRARGEWQSYDIVFRRPIVKDGKVLDPGRMTVFCNGVLVQDITDLEGGGGYRHRKPLNRVFPEKAPLRLQDHGDPVRFRNIWIRSIRPRALDGGFDGRLSPEAALVKRAETAAMIREKAVVMQGLDKAMLLLESLVYEADDDARAEADDLIADYLECFKITTDEQAKKQKDQLLNLDKAVCFMIKHKRLPDDYFAAARLNEIIDRYDWKRRR